MSKNTSFPWCLLIKFQLLLILCAVVIFVVMVYVIGIKGSCEPYKSAEWSGEQCLDQGDESYYEYCEELCGRWTDHGEGCGEYCEMVVDLVLSRREGITNRRKKRRTNRQREQRYKSAEWPKEQCPNQGAETYSEFCQKFCHHLQLDDCNEHCKQYVTDQREETIKQGKGTTN